MISDLFVLKDERELFRWVEKEQGGSSKRTTMFKSKARRWSQMAGGWWAVKLHKVGRARP